MNNEDEVNYVRRSRSRRTSRESWDLADDCQRLPSNSGPLQHSISDDPGLGLRLVEEISETNCSRPIRKKIRRGIVWQVAYGVPPTHAEG